MRNTRVKKVTMYETSDGRLFDTYKEGVAHQKEYERKAELNKATLLYQLNQIKQRNKL